MGRSPLPTVVLSVVLLSACHASDELLFRSDDFATPVRIPSDPLDRSVTSIKLRAAFSPEGDGKGAIALDVSPVRFNEFGEATRLHTKRSEPCPVTLKRIGIDDKSGKKRCLYEVVFADGSIQHRLLFVRSPRAAGHHRLLIRPGNHDRLEAAVAFAQQSPIGVGLAYVLPMYDAAGQA
jgi:hypothetical protein